MNCNNVISYMENYDENQILKQHLNITKNEYN